MTTNEKLRKLKEELAKEGLPLMFTRMRTIYPDFHLEVINAVLDKTLDEDLHDEVYQLFVPSTWFEVRVERKLDTIITLLGGDQ